MLNIYNQQVSMMHEQAKLQQEAALQQLYMNTQQPIMERQQNLLRMEIDSALESISTKATLDKIKTPKKRTIDDIVYKPGLGVFEEDLK